MKKYDPVRSLDLITLNYEMPFFPSLRAPTEVVGEAISTIADEIASAAVSQ